MKDRIQQWSCRWPGRLLVSDDLKTWSYFPSAQFPHLWVEDRNSPPICRPNNPTVCLLIAWKYAWLPEAGCTIPVWYKRKNGKKSTQERSSAMYGHTVGAAHGSCCAWTPCVQGLCREPLREPESRRQLIGAHTPHPPWDPMQPACMWLEVRGPKLLCSPPSEFPRRF